MNIIVKSNGEKIKIYSGISKKNKIVEYLCKGEYCFSSSNIYALVSNEKYENYALSYALTGIPKLYNTHISINERLISKKELEKISYYVGGGLNKYTYFRRLTVKNEINYALRINDSNFNLDDIIKMFSLTPNRLDRLLRYTGNEHWRASLAIGYAGGKKIFCFPFINKNLSSELMRLRIDEFIIKLRDNGNIIVLPIEKNSELINLSDIQYNI